MQEVMANHRALHSPIASAVHRASIIRLVAYAVDFVELYQVVISTERDCLMWCVVHQVVGYAVAYAAYRNGGLVHAVPPAIVMDVIVFSVVSGGSERLAVTTSEGNATVAGSVNIAADDTVVCASRNAHRPTTQVAEGTPCNAVASAA